MITESSPHNPESESLPGGESASPGPGSQTKPAKLKAADVRNALRKFYPPAEYAIAFEVANATGANVRRHLDVMVMSLWPSRGLDVTGIEIKVDRADWRREKAQPEKAKTIAQYCDFFCVAAPVGVVPDFELPGNWGLLEVGPAGTVRVNVKPRRLDPKTIGKHQLAAIWRAAANSDPEGLRAELARERQKLNDEFWSRVEKEVATQMAARRDRGNEAAESWRKLVAAVGVESNWRLDDEGLIAAVRAVHISSAARSHNGLQGLRNTLALALKGADEALAIFAPPAADGVAG